MRKKISALVAVREGSKRIPNKNIVNFAGSSLLEIKIDQLLRMTGIDEIIVSTDSIKMLKIAKQKGVTGILRDKSLASDDIPMNVVYEYLASLTKFEHVLYAHVTSPLLEDTSMMKCIEKYQNLSSEYDSLATVKNLQEYIWSNKGPVNYDPKNHPRSQDLPKMYALNFAVNMIEKKKMISEKNIVGKKFYPVVLNQLESIDVDEMEDFKMAETLYGKKHERV